MLLKKLCGLIQSSRVGTYPSICDLIFHLIVLDIHPVTFDYIGVNPLPTQSQHVIDVKMMPASLLINFNSVKP